MNNKLTKEQALNLLREKFNKLMSFSKQKFQDLPLTDGTNLCIDDSATLDTGVEVYTLDADGNQTPANDGDYTLTDGRTVSIKDGKVETVSAADTEAADQEETPQTDASNVTQEEMKKKKVDPNATPAEPVKQDATTDSTDGSDISTRVANLEQTLEQIMEMLQGMMNSQETAMSKVENFSKELKEFSNKPGSTPIKMEKTPHKQFSRVESFITIDDDTTRRKELLANARTKTRNFNISDSKI